MVDIITSKTHHPSKDWLNFVKTVKARSRIRQWIKVQDKDRSISLGSEMCEKAFRKYRLNFNSLQKTEAMNAVVADFGFKTVDDLLASVGYGKTTPLQMVGRFAPKQVAEETHESIFNKLIGRVRKKKPPSGVFVKGVDDILMKFGKCCQPVSGDPITGYITRGFGVTVHRTNCINALKMNPERQIDVRWDTGTTQIYPVKIRIRSGDRVGLLADVAATLSQTNVNILSANTQIQENGTVESFFTIDVENTQHIQRVITAIKKVRFVQEVKRIG